MVAALVVSESYNLVNKGTERSKISQFDSYCTMYVSEKRQYFIYFKDLLDITENICMLTPIYYVQG